MRLPWPWRAGMIHAPPVLGILFGVPRIADARADSRAAPSAANRAVGGFAHRGSGCMYRTLFRTVAGTACLLAATALLHCVPVDPAPNPDPNPSFRLFQAMFKYPAGAQPFALAAADLNGDGRQDIITANQNANTVSVLLGRSQGGFAGHKEYPVGGSPTAIATADFNGDGILDLAVANQGTHDVSILIGVGEGAFSEETRYTLADGAQPLALAAGDFNGDGAPDMATADFGLGTVSVLLGAGDGTFAAPETYAAGEGARWVIAEDLNGNGILDLATANRDTNGVAVLAGVGDGTFQEAVHWPTGDTPRMVAAADITGDGIPDLITSNPGSGDIALLRGLGSGLFGAAARYPVPRYLPTRFAMADFNGDGVPDVAALLFSGGANVVSMGLMAVFYGDRATGFTGPRIFGAGSQPFDIVAARIDTDARPDLVTADSNTNQISVIYGKAGGAFETDERFAAGDTPRMAAAADLNNDGRLDLVVVNQGSRDFSVLMGNGNGTFQAERRISLPDIPRALAIADLDKDGKPDVVITNLTQNRVSVFLGRGDGTFLAGQRYPVRPAGVSGAAHPRSVAIADLNRDSHPDIVTGNANADNIAVLLGKGDGTFHAAQEFFSGNFPLDVQLVDLKRDGIMDVVFLSTNDPDNPADQAEPRVVRRFGVGDGTFDEASNQRYATGNGPRGLAVGDLNRSGAYDAVTVHPGDNSVYVLTGRADGKFSRGERKRMGNNPNTVALADLNRDGLLDIITTNDINVVSVLLNRGSLAFYSFMNYPAGSQPIGGILADVNGDNRPDAILCNRGTGDISILLGAF